jgi:predicted dehydrogenase
MKLRTLVIGCGNIAGRFDMARGRNEAPLTHAGAYRRDGRFELAGCVEPDDARREEFMRHWQIDRGFKSATEVVAAGERYDVVSICSPTSSHAKDLEVVLALKPKLVFCEKPLTPSRQQSTIEVERYRRTNVLLAVNYTRRWDPAVGDLRAAIEEKRWGELRAVTGYYNKGLLNNGSHMLDLLLLLLGPLSVRAAGAPVEDFVPEDSSVPVWLHSKEQVPVQLACGDAGDFAFFELELVFARAVITMEEAGMAWRERQVRASPHFSGYRTLDAGERRAGGYPQAMLRSADNIYGAVTAGSPLASTGESALAAQSLCEEIRRS